jgi:prolyl oligopeptidase
LAFRPGRDRYFFLRNDGQQTSRRCWFRRGIGARRVLIDRTRRRDATVSPSDFVPSPDGRCLLRIVGGRIGSIRWRVRDVQTGTDLPEVLRDTKFKSVSWARDGSGFYYSAYPGGDDQRQAVVRWHRIGEAQSGDREVFAVRDHPTRVPYGTVSEDGRYLVIILDEGTLSNGVLVMALGGSAAVEPVFVKYDGIYSYLGSRTGVGTELLFRTTAGAPNGRVVAVDLGRAGAQRQRVIVPESSSVLESAALVGDRVIGADLQDAHSVVQLFDAATGQARGAVSLPGPGAVAGFTGRPGDPESFYSFTDFSAPARIYRLDMASGATTLLRQPRFAADTSAYVTEQVFYRSKDGTRVPMFIVHRRDFRRDAGSPVLLYGYGGSTSPSPWFSPATVMRLRWAACRRPTCVVW